MHLVTKIHIRNGQHGVTNQNFYRRHFVAKIGNTLALNWLETYSVYRAAKFFWSISVISTLKISNFQRKSVIFFVESIGYENTISI